ncbi:MAG: helix-turn-helix domain-containing protein [Acidimicrobiia bacterium]
MNGSEGSARGGTDVETPAVPKLRADAARNRERILDAARTAFAHRGPDASLDEIAKAAGVGTGTLYRHFPTRDDLVQAVFVEGIETLQQQADALLDSDRPGEALGEWLRAQMAHGAACRGLGAEAMLAMLDRPESEPPVCASMRASGGALLARAQAANAVRDDVDVDDLMRMMQAIELAAADSPDPASAQRLFDLVFDGLRPR